MFGLFGKSSNKVVQSTEKQASQSVDYSDYLVLKSRIQVLQGKIGGIEKALYKLEEFADTYAEIVSDIEDFIEFPIDDYAEDDINGADNQPVHERQQPDNVGATVQRGDSTDTARDRDDSRRDH
jgi:hypothetical protein